jgi:hypothetical protein
MGQNPFPQKPPRFVRAVLYQYHFSNSRNDAAPAPGGVANTRAFIVRLFPSKMPDQN